MKRSWPIGSRAASRSRLRSQSSNQLAKHPFAESCCLQITPRSSSKSPKYPSQSSQEPPPKVQWLRSQRDSPEKTLRIIDVHVHRLKLTATGLPCVTAGNSGGEKTKIKMEWVWVKKRYRNWNPGKWKKGLKSVVSWWFRGATRMLVDSQGFLFDP